jgi:hypothetical protein
MSDTNLNAPNQADQHEAMILTCDQYLNNNTDQMNCYRARLARAPHIQKLSKYMEVFLAKIDIPPAFPNWSLFNPSILRRSDGSVVIMVRSSNYQYNSGNYIMPPEDNNKIRTKSILLHCNEDLSVYRRSVLKDPFYVSNGFSVEGLEDARLFEINGILHVSATVRDVAPYDGSCRIGVAKINEATEEYTDLTIITPKIIRQEKNWMPIVPSNEMKWLYASSHFNRCVQTVYDGNELKTRAVELQGSLAEHFRGGSQFVNYGSGFIGIIHEVAEFPTGRVYSHRFIHGNHEGFINAYSKPFFLKEQMKIEFAAGMMLQNNDLYVTFGYMDAEAWIAKFSLLDVLKWMLN